MELDQIMSPVVDSLDPIEYNGKTYTAKFFQGYITDFNSQIKDDRRRISYPCFWLVRDFAGRKGSYFTEYRVTVWALIEGDKTVHDPDALNRRIRPILRPLVDQFKMQLTRAGVFVQKPVNEVERPKVGTNESGNLNNGSIARKSENPFNNHCDGIQLDLTLQVPNNLSLTCFNN